MDTQLLLSNITNPTLLFFLLGIVAYLVKSDLEIPPTTIKFISLYLLFSIGFKGGQELAHEHLNWQVTTALLFGAAIASAIPFYAFCLLRKCQHARPLGIQVCDELQRVYRRDGSVSGDIEITGRQVGSNQQG